MKTWSDCRAATLISDRSEVYRGCHRLFPRRNRPFQVRNVSPMEGRSEGRKERRKAGRGEPSIFELFPCARGEKSWKISWKILWNFLSRYKILSPWITQAPPRFTDRRFSLDISLFSKLRKCENRFCRIERLNYAKLIETKQGEPFRGWKCFQMFFFFFFSF